MKSTKMNQICLLKNSLKHKGITLIEIMVAMAIMLIVLSAILLNVSSSTRSGAMQQNISNMMENGQMALNVLTRSIRNAGFQDFIKVPTPIEDRERFGQYIQGCSNGSFSGVVSTAPEWAASTCIAGGSSDAIAVRFQGGQLQELPGNNGLVNLLSADCSGQPVIGADSKFNRGDGTDITIVDNRFFISDNELRCWGNGGKTALGLVENIEAMRLWYGVSDRVKDTSGAETLAAQTARYMTASDIDNKYGAEEDRWNRVTAVRVCVLVRSANKVSSPSYTYTDCSGEEKTPTDGFLRRAMFTTIEVANVATGL